jgi:flavin reductase (DIM6/NTAB) family NADH-FMN oxidoreductase RutF
LNIASLLLGRLEGEGDMSIIGQCRKVIKKLMFGDTLLPQAFTIGLTEPQGEITVWLHGMGSPIDVTRRHSMVCADPFTVCIAFDEEEKFTETEPGRLSLKFCERDGQRRVLGKISFNGKRTTDMLSGGSQLVLFEARNSANYCLPKARIWAHYLLHRYSLWRKVDSAGIKMSFLERRAVMVMFIRPHPVVLVSIESEAGGNIFPMNIMGDLGQNYFAFALKNSRLAARLVEHAGRVALSDVPLSQTPLAYRLGANHGKPAIDWNELPFATKVSAKLKVPVPVFALRVREMEIEKIHNLGSHTFFVARIIHDERFAEDVGLCIVHGFYQAWRLKGHRKELATSLADDLFNKRGTPHSSLPL